MTLGRAIAGLALLTLFLLASPFLAGVQNIIGLIIIAVGLYEAWKLNRRRMLTISGPHTITSTGPAVQRA